MSTEQRRARRSRGQTRQEILDAARKHFGQSGYQGTSIRDIAAEAGISDALIFRHFASKDELFEAAVLQPYRGFVESWLEQVRSVEELSTKDLVEAFVVGMYDFVTEHRDLLFALVVANRFGTHSASTAGSMSEEVRLLAEFTGEEARKRGIRHEDVEMMASCTVAMVLSMVVLDDLLFLPGDEHPSRERVLREMTAFALGGIEGPRPS